MQKLRVTIPWHEFVGKGESMATYLRNKPRKQAWKQKMHQRKKLTVALNRFKLVRVSPDGKMLIVL